MSVCLHIRVHPLNGFPALIVTPQIEHNCLATAKDTFVSRLTDGYVGLNASKDFLSKKESFQAERRLQKRERGERVRVFAWSQLRLSVMKILKDAADSVLVKQIDDRF